MGQELEHRIFKWAKNTEFGEHMELIHSCITGEKAKDVVEEAYCSTLLCLLGNQAMEEQRMITFPEEYKIPYMKF